MTARTLASWLSKTTAPRPHMAAGAVLAILMCLAAAQPAAARDADAGQYRENAISAVPTSQSTDDRIQRAATECAKALAGKLHIQGFGVLLAAVQGDSEAGLRSSIIAAQSAVTREVWNNFYQIPYCALLVLDLEINPGQVGEGDFGAVSSNFIGTWRGEITQQNPPIPPYAIEVLIGRGQVGLPIASGHYSGTSPCDFHWNLVSADTTHLVVDEVVESGNCFNNVRVSLVLNGDGTTAYEFENGNGRGELRRP